MQIIINVYVLKTNRDTLMALPLSQEEMKKVDQPISSIDSQQEKKETKASSQCFSCKKEFTLFVSFKIEINIGIIVINLD